MPKGNNMFEGRRSRCPARHITADKRRMLSLGRQVSRGRLAGIFEHVGDPDVNTGSSPLQGRR